MKQIFKIVQKYTFELGRAKLWKAKGSKKIRQIILVGFILIGSFAVIFATATKLEAIKQNNEIIGYLAKNMGEISQNKDLALTKTKQMAQDPFVEKLLTENKYDELNNYCQGLMISKKISYLVITDTMGNVLIRAHRPKTIGDNIFATSQIKMVEKAKYIGLEEGPEEQFYSTAEAPIRNDKKEIVGAVFGGYLFNDALARQLVNDGNYGLAFLKKDAVIGDYAKENKIRRLLGYSDLPKKMGDKNLNEPALFKYENKDYLIITKEILNSENDLIGKMLLVKNNNGRENIFWWVEAIFGLVIVLGGVYFYLDIKKGHGKNVWGKIKNNPSYLIIAAVVILGEIVFIRNFDLNKRVIHTQVSIVNSQSIYAQYTKNYYHINETIEYKIWAQSREKVKTATLKVLYSPTVLGAAEINLEKSVCGNQVEKGVEGNTINFSCDMADNKKNVPRLLATIIFKGTAAGIGKVEIDSAKTFFQLANGGKLPLYQQIKDNFIITK